MIKSLIHLVLLLPVVLATQAEPITGELVVVHQVGTDGLIFGPGQPHVVIVAEEDDDLDALLLEGFDFGDAEVMSLCPVEAACARQPTTTAITTAATTTIVTATVTDITTTVTNNGGGDEPVPSQTPSAPGKSQSRDHPIPFIAQNDKNNIDNLTCLEVIVIRGEERCVVWKGKAREDGSSQRIVRNTRLRKA